VLDVALNKPATDSNGWYNSLRNYSHDMERDGIPELSLPKGHQGVSLGTMRSRNDGLAYGFNEST
jgi:hypothetical protein